MAPGERRGRATCPPGRVPRSRWPAGLPGTVPVRAVLAETVRLRTVPVEMAPVGTVRVGMPRSSAIPPCRGKRSRRPGSPDRRQWMHAVRSFPKHPVFRWLAPTLVRAWGARVGAVVRRARARVPKSWGGGPLRGRCPRAHARIGRATGCPRPDARPPRGPGSRVGTSFPIAPSTVLRPRAMLGQPLPSCGASRPCGGAPARCSRAASGSPFGCPSPGKAPSARGDGAGGAAW